MRYQHLKTARKIRTLLVPLVPILIVALFVITKAEVPSFATNGVHTVAQPIWSVRDNVGDKASFVTSYFTSKANLINENTALKQEVLERTRETYTTRALLYENEQLRTLLNRVDARPELMPASVMHSDSYSPYDTFFIDIGSREGVRDHMLVITPENIAIGSITKTLEHTAIVTQFSAAGHSFNVLLGATSSVHTTLTGYGSGTMLISIPRDIQVEEGDSVTLPSFTMYAIGTVASIDVAPEDAYKELYIRSPANAYRLRHVLVDTTSTWTTKSTVDEVDTEEER